MHRLFAAGLALVVVTAGAACGSAKTAPAGPGSAAPSGGASSSSTSSSSFTLCEGTYALCTTARCQPIPKASGSNGAGSVELACGCETRVGYSAGTQACSQVPQKQPAKGMQVPSRYAPVSSMAVCMNDRPWAWCLDMPCTIDDDLTHATCVCTQTSTPTQPYVVVANSFDSSTCTTDLWSSAAIDDILQITGFLQQSKELQPHPITILGVGAEHK